MLTVILSAHTQTSTCTHSDMHTHTGTHTHTHTTGLWYAWEQQILLAGLIFIVNFILTYSPQPSLPPSPSVLLSLCPYFLSLSLPLLVSDLWSCSNIDYSPQLSGWEVGCFLWFKAVLYLCSRGLEELCWLDHLQLESEDKLIQPRLNWSKQKTSCTIMWIISLRQLLQAQATQKLTQKCRKTSGLHWKHFPLSRHCMIDTFFPFPW